MILGSARGRQAGRVAFAADRGAPGNDPSAPDAAIVGVPHGTILGRPASAGILVAMQAEPSSPDGGAIAESFRRRVDDEVERALAARRDQVATLAPEALALIDEIARLFRAGGKRLRPLFCFWGHLGGGGWPVRRFADGGFDLSVVYLPYLYLLTRLRVSATPSFLELRPSIPQTLPFQHLPAPFE